MKREQTNRPTDLIAEIIWEKENDLRKTGVAVDKTDKETLETFNRDLWGILVDKCDGEAIRKVNAADQGEGMWAFVRLHQWFNTTTELGKMEAS